MEPIPPSPELTRGRLSWQRGIPRASLSRQLIADAALLLVTLIWGSTFVMVKDAVARYPVFSFLALRFTCAALVLLPFVLWQPRGRNSSTGTEGLQTGDRNSAWAGTAISLRQGFPWLASLLIGSALFAGYGFQTLGLRLTTPAKAGFITGLSVVIVPLVAALLLHQPAGRRVWLGVAFATAGLALLTLQPGLQVEPGDLLVLGCALSFAGHILLTGRFAPRHHPLMLTLGQVVVVAALSAAVALAFEVRPPLSLHVLMAALFTGVLATSVAFGTQTIAQRFTTSTHTALIFAAEPVFAALFSFLLVGEKLGPQQLAGCGLILAGMVVAEIKRR